MSFEALFLLIILLGEIFLLIKEIFPPPIVFFVAISILVLFNILSPQEALSGFSNVQIATIVLLLISSYAIQKLKVLPIIFSKILHYHEPYRQFLLKLMALVSFFSAFLNNTPIVTLLIPYVSDWAKRNNLPLSKVLIPLSYSAIVGGTITLIGTSTNLLVAALYEKYAGKPLNLWDFTPIGLFLAIALILYFYFLGYKYLPDREEPIKSFIKQAKNYLVELHISQNSPLIGKTIKEAGLRNLKGLFLAEIIRGGKIIRPVNPSEMLQKDDILIFVGNTKAINDLLNMNLGLEPPKGCHLPFQTLDVIEAVIPSNSLLIGKTIKELNFRAKYDAAVIGIHRRGEILRGKLGTIKLKAGDLLLLWAGKDFYKKLEDFSEIYVLNQVGNIYKFPYKKGILLFIIFLIIIFLSSLQIISLFKGLLLYILLLLILKTLSFSEIKKNIDLNLVFTASLSLALGKAMITTGLADYIAATIIQISKFSGVLGVIITLYLITYIFTEFVTNLAAAAITFPIAVSLAEHLQIELKPLALLIAFAASGSFISPVGYQTNLIIFSLGNYKFSDFVKIGLPVSILYGFITITLIYFIYFSVK